MTKLVVFIIKNVIKIFMSSIKNVIMVNYWQTRYFFAILGSLLRTKIYNVCWKVKVVRKSCVWPSLWWLEMTLGYIYLHLDWDTDTTNQQPQSLLLTSLAILTNMQHIGILFHSFMGRSRVMGVSLLEQIIHYSPLLNFAHFLRLSSFNGNCKNTKALSSIWLLQIVKYIQK